MRLDSSLLPPSLLSSAKTGGARLLSPLEALAKRDPEQARKLEDAQNQLEQVRDSMRSSKSDLKEQIKAKAREKIARLKEQIKTLRMMMGSDPKMIAQQAARLAKELAAAVKDYASAGGTDIAPTPVVANTSSSSQASTENTDTDTPSLGDQPPQDDADAQNPGLINISDVPDEKEGKQDDGQGDRKFPIDMAAFSSRQMDFAFTNEAKKLADELKVILKQLRAKIGSSHDPANKDVKEGEDTLRDIDKSLKTIVAQASAPQLNVQA